MKSKKEKLDSADELDRMANDTSDIRPLTPAMRQKWEAAKRTGAKIARGRPRKAERDKSRIVPVSMDPRLLKEVDSFARTVGLSRSRLVAEGLQLRMKT